MMNYWDWLCIGLLTIWLPVQVYLIARAWELGCFHAYLANNNKLCQMATKDRESDCQVLKIRAEKAMKGEF